MTKKYLVTVPVPKMTPPADDGLSGVLLSMELEAETAPSALTRAIGAFAETINLDAIADRSGLVISIQYVSGP